MENQFKITVHPSVLYSIADAYERRDADKHRVIGTLLGNFEKNVIEITNSFIVPHDMKENDVCMDIEFGNTMYRLMQFLYPSEKVVGWYSTGSEISEPDVLVHEDVYKQFTANPVFLLIDTNVQDIKIKAIDKWRLNVRAYISKAIGVPQRRKGTVFTPLTVHVEASLGERNAINIMDEGICNDVKHILLRDDNSILIKLAKDMQRMLAEVVRHVDNVIERDGNVSYEIGKKLSEVIYAVPSIDTEQWKKMSNLCNNDSMLILYICSLIRAQVKLKESIINF